MRKWFFDICLDTPNYPNGYSLIDSAFNLATKFMSVENLRAHVQRGEK
jgi:hypothetical protein